MPSTAPTDSVGAVRTEPPGGPRPALLELVAPGRLDEDLLGIDEHLQESGLAPRPSYLREVARGRVPVEGAGLVAGRLPFVRAALRRIGVDAPPPLDYVGASDETLGRRVWPSTLGAVAAGLERDGEPVFVKPRGSTKQFTGRVVGEAVDLRSIRVSSPSTPVWCSDVVTMVSEHRVFLVDGEVVGVRNYDGDVALVPAAEAVAAILDDVGPSLPAGCALDVAVRPDGRVVLVEANEGYSLGRYGLDAGAYARLLLARWRELTGEPAAD